MLEFVGYREDFVFCLKEEGVFGVCEWEGRVRFVFDRIFGLF